MKKSSLIFISFLVFIPDSVMAASKTNPDISVNVLLLGKKSFSKDKHEEEETYKELLKNRAKHFSRTLKGNKESPSASEDSHLHKLNEGFSLQEVEIYFKSNIDPYWVGNVSLGIAPHGNHVDIDLEEAYVESLFIPDWTFRAGKFYAFLGRHNNFHTRHYPFIVFLFTFLPIGFIVSYSLKKQFFN